MTASRPLIDIFSPLPPLATEIANHTEIVLEALQDLARVRVWTSQDEPVELRAQNVELCRYTPDTLPIRRLNEADATFYNLGNNPSFHRSIHEAARRVPGIVVLHDTRLQHFFDAYSEHPGPDRDYYLEQLGRWHGPVMRAKGEAYARTRQGFQELVDTAPMTHAAICGATACILHNPDEMAALTAQTTVPLYYVPLAGRAGPAPAPRPPHDPSAPIKLIMFGFLAENRRLLPILETLAAIPDRDRYRLDIYGIVAQARQVDDLIASAGLGAIVTRHGFVPAAELDAALASADLALNLRWPSMGEASATQLRIWAAGLPALVTDVGWYAHLPPDSVFAISPDREREGIVHHLRAYRDNPGIYAAAGRRGRQVLEQTHSPRAYAEALVRIASEHATQHGRGTSARLASRAAEALLNLGPAELARPLGMEIGQHIADLTGR